VVDGHQKETADHQKQSRSLSGEQEKLRGSNAVLLQQLVALQVVCQPNSISILFNAPISLTGLGTLV